MSEWWTYRLGDFLMFSPATYWRLVEQYNRDLWPAQALGLTAGLIALWLTTRRVAAALRIQAAVLALAFLWVGWGFYFQHYSSINWAAIYLAAAFGVQATLLAVLSLARASGAPDAIAHSQQLGRWLGAAGLIAYPLAGGVVGALTGLPWSRLEVFGISPEPTALAGLGLLLARPDFFSRRWHAALLIIPTLSLIVGAATHLAMAG
jgi:Family of unknown function (DUF6064)